MMKRKELEAEIKALEEKISQYQRDVIEMKKLLNTMIEQEKERKNYISSSEIVDLIYEQTGRKINMSTIKRWADEGYLGEIIEEREKFWALRHKQGKKRFLYPIVNVYQFLYEKGYLRPKYDVLDRVEINDPKRQKAIGIVIDSVLKDAEFYYTVQVEDTFERWPMVREEHLKKLE